MNAYQPATDCSISTRVRPQLGTHGPRFLNVSSYRHDRKQRQTHSGTCTGWYRLSSLVQVQRQRFCLLAFNKIASPPSSNNRSQQKIECLNEVYFRTLETARDESYDGTRTLGIAYISTVHRVEINTKFCLINATLIFGQHFIFLY